MNDKHCFQDISQVLTKQNNFKTLLDSFLDTIEEGILLLNKQGIIIKHNIIIQNILDVNYSLIGKSFNKICPQYKECYKQNICILKYKNKNLKINSKTLELSNSYIYFLFIDEYYPNLTLDKNSPSNKNYKQRCEQIFNSINQGIHAIDTSGRLFIYNSYLEKIEGYNANEVIGKYVEEVYNLNWQTSLLLKALNEKRPILNIHQNYTIKSGKRLDVIASAFPLYHNDEIVGSICIYRDLTNYEELSKKLHEKSKYINNNIECENDEKQDISQNKLLGNNKKFLESIRWAESASQTTSPVLIYGETGTGKELFARSIHNKGYRSQKPFLPLNCAAIPENLLEGILFGTVKGAFTGAIDRKGLLEQANGGTLFLDEINSMPLALQAKLLRVLEDKKITRLGDKKEISIDIRVISSINIKPSVCIKDQKLREDLFYRLAVVYLVIPPLRERLDDIELLSNYFIDTYNKHLNKNVKGLSSEVLSSFQNYHWPGNVRQLKHAIEGAMNICPTDEQYIKISHIPKYLGMFKKDKSSQNTKTLDNNSKNINLFDEIELRKKKKIIDVLKANKGNITKAAKELGMSRQCLQYRIKKYNLK